MAHDIIRDPVKNALIKDGWTITHDPLMLKHEEIKVFVDLGAERVIAAERQGEKIAIEIKSFLGKSPIDDLEEAIGQYTLYAKLLSWSQSDRHLYIAISATTYTTLFQGKGVKKLFTQLEIPLIVVDLKQEEVVAWIKT